MEKQIVQIEADSITFERLGRAGGEGWKFKLHFEAHDKADLEATLESIKRLDDWHKNNMVAAKVPA